MAAKAIVGILMGSDSDLPVMQETADILKKFGVPFEMTVSSAHRTPARTARYAKTAEKRGIKIIIAGAGSAAHLAGFIAAETTLPVIGVPIDAGPLKGLDALLSTVQMPGGVPVASMAIGKAGARNAGVFAAEVLALSDPKLAEKIKEYRKEMIKQVEQKARNIKV
ncbi:MAG: 5-(carboxyamino)imidazole ribonucleotide mutase [Thermodesulfobacteriota bacterium]|nr:MAG: 5-(carboxyamino)imidazole ribonucleotide mutase [Thermodesulfobacteriota bacterium]